MIFDHNNIRLRKPGKLTKTTYANEIAAAVNALPSGMRLGAQRPDLAPGFMIWGVVTNTGPQEEDDYDDARHWVKLQYIPAAALTAGVTFEDDATLAVGEDTDAIVTVTNLAAGKNDAENDDGAHTLLVGDVVRVFGEVDAGGGVRYTTFAPVEFRFALLTKTSGTGVLLDEFKYTAKTRLGTTIDTDVDHWGNLVPPYKVTEATFGIIRFFCEEEPKRWRIVWCNEWPHERNTSVVTNVACNGDGTLTVTTDTIYGFDHS